MEVVITKGEKQLLKKLTGKGRYFFPNEIIKL